MHHHHPAAVVLLSQEQQEREHAHHRTCAEVEICSRPHCSCSHHAHSNLPPGVRIRGALRPGYDRVLTRGALQFVADLQRAFGPRVRYALQQRQAQQARYDAGELPGWDPATEDIRKGQWTCAPLPPALADRRVEITGPVERKMIINALNSGAKVFMADFEDSLSPTWDNVIQGQINLQDAVAGTIAHHDDKNNRSYRLNDATAVLMVRPRGWHLVEAHIEVDGEPAVAAIVDFGLYFFHNHAEFRAKHGGSGPFFYLPKMEHHREAAIWDAIFSAAEASTCFPRGSIRATVLIETLPAAFQMHEILFELRDHSAGLNCGRWDYIFSFIKTFRNNPTRLLPDRTHVGMTQRFLRTYTELLIKTCHSRGVQAMGGMAAQIPIKDDKAANDAALAAVRVDKLREVRAGHDGTWAAHPGLIPLVLEVFHQNMPGENQLGVRRDDVKPTQDDLLEMPRGKRSLEGLRLNTRVGIQYLAAWLAGTGSVPLYHLMEDAATAEISRVQIWQWIHHAAVLDGELVPVPVTKQLFGRVVDEELGRIRREVGEDRFRHGRFLQAARLFVAQCVKDELDDFLTLDAYRGIVRIVPDSRL